MPCWPYGSFLWCALPERPRYSTRHRVYASRTLLRYRDASQPPLTSIALLPGLPPVAMFLAITGALSMATALIVMTVRAATMCPLINPRACVRPHIQAPTASLLWLFALETTLSWAALAVVPRWVRHDDAILPALMKLADTNKVHGLSLLFRMHTYTHAPAQARLTTRFRRYLPSRYARVVGREPTSVACSQAPDVVVMCAYIVGDGALLERCVVGNALPCSTRCLLLSTEYIHTLARACTPAGHFA